MNFQNKIVEYYEVRARKTEFVMSQRYEEASNARSIERKTARDIYESMNGLCGSGDAWKKYEDWIDSYCMEKYGRTDITRSVIREIIIDRLGL